MKNRKPKTENRNALATRRSPLVTAFTLMELTVSVAILAGVMAMVGMIFHTAGKATSQAQSSSSVYRQLLFAAEAIRRDLEGMDKKQDRVLGIASMSVLAYENEKDRNSGRVLNVANAQDPHRADVLMMLTSRQFDPYIFQQNPASPIDFGAFKQVVYGHADIGTLDAAGTNWIAGSVKRIEGTAVAGQSDLTAFEWHLGRRVVGFPVADLVGPFPTETAAWPLTDPAFLFGAADVLQDPTSANPSLTARLLKHRSTPSYLFVWGGLTYLFDNNNWYHQNTTDQRWYIYSGPNAIPGSDWTRTENGVVVGPISTPHTLATLQTVALDTSTPTAPSLANLERNLFYDPSVPDHRTRLASNPPTGDNERLANYFLPSCSEFKVEFTYDDPHEIEVIVDPADANNRIVDTTGGLDLNNDGTMDTPGAKPIRWQSVPAGEQWVWSGLSVGPNNRTDPHRWPRALRITMRAYGGSDRLERPITYTLIHAFK